MAIEALLTCHPQAVQLNRLCFGRNVPSDISSDGKLAV